MQKDVTTKALWQLSQGMYTNALWMIKTGQTVTQKLLLRRMQNELGVEDPTVYKFIDGLKKTIQLISEQDPPAKVEILKTSGWKN